jgi:hypothetical protein
MWVATYEIRITSSSPIKIAAVPSTSRIDAVAQGSPLGQYIPPSTSETQLHFIDAPIPPDSYIVLFNPSRDEASMVEIELSRK